MPTPTEQPIPRESLVRSGLANLYVRDIGHGVPIIVLHGGPDFDHEYFLPELDRLAELVRLIYYDQRGRGRSFSGGGADNVTLAGEIEDLDRIRDWTRLDAVAVLGHSWGGVVAMEYAIRHPERVTHLILMNTAPASHAGILEVRRHLRERRSPEQFDRMSEIALTPAFEEGDIDAEAEYYRIHFGTTLHEPELLDDVITRLRINFTGESVVAARAIEHRLYEQTWSSEDYNLIPKLRLLDVPALLIHGEHDLIPIDVVREIAEAIPGSRLVELDGCGHFSYLEHTDRVVSVIGEFLAQSQ